MATEPYTDTWKIVLELSIRPLSHPWSEHLEPKKILEAIEGELSAIRAVQAGITGDK